eukprot:CAMPEP_0197033562 /NCGR_PEP_ID=MMETSP1384-20130603/11941_1 /TAXON_ID=29189 /ORGANISM="Ammonia sp." /LENGTH=155 /DNA_ID=CAMNT_0042463389 /DNA_START=71 /DNA_END=538 /DNA_ORIENTATION=-
MKGAMLLIFAVFMMMRTADSSRLLLAGCEAVRCAACTECVERGNSGARCVSIDGCCSTDTDCGENESCLNYQCEAPCMVPMYYDPYCCGGTTYGNKEAAACDGVNVKAAKCGRGECCGGFAGTACPDGKTCEDLPRDGCDPKNGGADCMGYCVLP